MATDDILRRAKRARRDAEAAASAKLMRWFSEKKAEIDSDPDLDDEERRVAKQALMMEFGRRSKSALAKAKRDNSPGKLMMREAQAEIDARRGR